MQFVAYKVIASALALLAKEGALDPEPPFKALGQMSGADSQIEAPRVELVQDDSAWAKLWKDHRQASIVNAGPGVKNQVQDTDQRPKVDFAKYVILGLFGGQSRNVTGFTLAEATDHEGVAYVRIRPTLLPSGGASLLQNPYIMLVLPRTKRKLMVQLDQTQLGGQGWRTLGSFGPTVHESKKLSTGG